LFLAILQPDDFCVNVMQYKEMKLIISMLQLGAFLSEKIITLGFQQKKKSL
jgi:hypothetical protein